MVGLRIIGRMGWRTAWWVQLGFAMSALALEACRAAQSGLPNDSGGGVGGHAQQPVPRAVEAAASSVEPGHSSAQADAGKALDAAVPMAAPTVMPPSAAGVSDTHSVAAQDAAVVADSDDADVALLPSHPLADPGRDDWVPVPAAAVRSVCRLDPDALARVDKLLDTPWAVVRYGRLCHAYKTDMMMSNETLSATKMFGATVAGAVAYQTRELPKNGRKTGPLSDSDRVDNWIDSVSYNRDAHVAHVLGMVAQSTDLSYGKRQMDYDMVGIVQLDSLSEILNAAVRQDKSRLGDDLDAFVQRDFFGPLGMKHSAWSGGLPDKAFAWSWSTTVLDMARVGLLILRGGMWSGTRLVEQEWTYRMTHPAFEDANTGFGYCTWLNASSNYTLGNIPVPDAWTNDVGKKPHFPGSCAPVSIYRTHPHGLSEAPDCNYSTEYSCDQRYDVGVWQSVAGFGTVIQGHPGLDLVLVGWQLTPDDFYAMPSAARLWDAVRPAVIAADPRYAGDEHAFCAAYGANEYAPDLP